MRKFFIMQKIAEYVSGRKINFFLTTILMMATLYMTSMVLHIYGKSVSYMMETKNVFSDKDILNIQILMDDTDNNDYFEKVEHFYNSMQDKFGEEYGKYMELIVNYTVDGQTRNMDTLFVDKSAFDLCRVTFYRDEAVYAMVQKDESRISGYVSKDKLETYPIGTVFTNGNIGTETVIVGYFENDAKWAPSLLLHSSQATLTLNSYLVSEMDESYFAFSKMFYGNTLNSVYVKMDDTRHADEYKEEIRKLAGDSHIKCYIFTLDELIKKEKQENKTLMKSLGTMVAFALFVAMSGILASYLADVGSWQKEIAIMYLNGVSPWDVYVIVLLENLIKAILGMALAIYGYGHKLSACDFEIYRKLVVPTLVLGTLICVTLFSYIAFRTVRQKNLLSIYGGVRL